MIIDISMFSKEVKNSKTDNNVHIVNDPINAKVVDLWTSIVNMNRKIRFIPISAGITAAVREAKSVPLFNAIKMNAIIMVDGSVPSIPPTFVPYFSAIIVMIITIIAERMNGKII